jgi:predicted MPP superfamily phosphohydrolase
MEISIINEPNITDVVFISDVHFGVRNGSLEWNNNIKNYFNDFFIPHVKSIQKRGRKVMVVVAGDYFDSRQHIDINVMNTACDVMEELTKVCPVYMLVGNHDIYKNNELDITSLRCLRNIKKVCIIDKISKVVIKNDVKFLPGNSELVKNNIVKIIETFLDIGYEQKDLQVLAPMYDGSIGIYALNDLLQEIFNPKSELKKEHQIGRFTYRVGDKILQLKNQPDDDVYNGDIGILIDITKEDNKSKTYLIVDFDGTIVKYDSNTFANITLGYCISVHKAQGSEYNVVIMPVSHEYGIMLRRKLIYTGITRTKKYLYLLGNINALSRGVKLEDTIEKNFTLRQRIEKLLY